MVVVVDTCGWIEWLTDGQLANAYAPYLKTLDEVMVPTSVQFELYQWVCRETTEARALEVIGVTEQAQVEPLTTSTALLAADLAMQHQLSFADAIIYAAARQHQVKLVTSDNHFEGLQSVEYLRKASR